MDNDVTYKRACFVATRQGKTERLVKSMTEAEQIKVAALMEVSGAMVAGVADKFRQILIDYYADRKATDASLDQPAKSTKRTKK